MAARLSEISRGLQSRIREFFDQPPGVDATPLELREAVLEEIEARVQPVGRGRRVLPYNRIRIQAILRNADRPAFEATFQDIDARVRERLGELQCPAPKDLDVQVVFLPEAPEGWLAGRLFAVEWESLPETPVQKREDPRPLALRVGILKGAATQETYVFADREVTIGRTSQAADHLGRVRRNHIAFLDASDGATETVGRAHARLKFDTAAGEYRVFDEGSRNGTSIVRAGTVIPVPSRDPRGVRVESGDEIQLGRAVIQVSFD